MDQNTNPEPPSPKGSVVIDNRKKFQFLVLDSQPDTPQVGYMHQTKTGIILNTNWRPAEPRLHYTIPHLPFPYPSEYDMQLAELQYGAE